MEIINCNRSYAAQILDILNEAILNSTALYDYQPRRLESMDTWFAVKEQHQYPVIGLVNERGTLLAFGSYGTFRAWPAYKYTVEHSVYVHKDHRGKGHGKMILQALIHEARKQEYHCIMAGIDADNEASIALHTSLGFKVCGVMREVGYKFDRWLSLCFYQLLLETPAKPEAI
jgi:L-amino acid N-acyltransferase YncA